MCDMKRMWKLFAASFLALTAVSCDEFPFGDGDNEGDDNGGAPIVNALPYVDPADRIVARQEGRRITYFDYNSEGFLSKTTEYKDNFNWFGEEGVAVFETEYSYQGLLVKTNTTVTSIAKVGEYDELYKTAGKDTYIKKSQLSEKRRTEGILNPAGYLTGVTEYVMEFDYSDNKYSEVLHEVLAYTYGSDGRLAGVIERDYEPGGNSQIDFSYVYKWKGDNIESVDYGDGEKYSMSYLDEEYVWPGINLYWDLDATDIYGDLDITGLDGAKWSNLLHKVSARNPQTNEEVWVEMVYTYDNKGRVKTINYKWHEDGEDYFDEDDAVVFYYGDETLPASGYTLPPYLVKQEFVGSSFHETKWLDGVLVNMEQFSVTKKIKNIFSDGKTSTVEWDTPGAFYASYDDEMTQHRFVEWTRDQFENFKADHKPEFSMSVVGDGTPDYALGYATLDFPHVGEISARLTVSGDESPFVVSLYDSTVEEGVNRYVIKDYLTQAFLGPKIRYSYDLRQWNTDATDGTELWEFEVEMWFDLEWSNDPALQKYPGIFAMTINVPKAE